MAGIATTAPGESCGFLEKQRLEIVAAIDFLITAIRAASVYATRRETRGGVARPDGPIFLHPYRTKRLKK